MPRKPAIAAVAALFGLSAAGIALAGGSPDLQPRPLIVSAGQKSVEVRVGSHCTLSVPNDDGEALGQCADYAAPKRPPRHRLRVHPRQVVELTFEDNPKILDRVIAVRATPVHISPNGYDYHPKSKRPRPVDDEGRVWRLRLPRRLHHANALDVFAELDEGDASYTAGFRRKRHGVRAATTRSQARGTATSPTRFDR